MHACLGHINQCMTEHARHMVRSAPAVLQASAGGTFRCMPSLAKLMPSAGSGISGGTSSAGRSTAHLPSASPALAKFWHSSQHLEVPLQCCSCPSGARGGAPHHPQNANPRLPACTRPSAQCREYTGKESMAERRKGGPHHTRTSFLVLGCIVRKNLQSLRAATTSALCDISVSQS